MSIKQNESYRKEGAFSSLKNFRYIPRSYSGAFRKGTFKGKSMGDPGYTDDIKEAEMTKYGRELMAATGSQPRQNFLKPTGDLGAPVPLPEDYGGFMDPMSFSDSKLSWGTPEEPVIRNITSGGVTGQYVQDTKNKDLLVKSIRGKNISRDNAIRAGRPGAMWQIDHIMPLTLGGADTDENRQILASGENDKKTRAQSVAYTLYGYGDITLNEARAMAMQWQDKDVTDVPQPSSTTGYVSDTKGKSGIEIAREVNDRWKNHRVGIKDVLAEVPDTMKNLGEGWLPDPVRELVKGAISGLSFGFLPYELDDDVSKGSKQAGHIGNIIGTVGSFMMGSAALGIGAKIILRGYKGVAALAAVKAGYKGAKTIKGLEALKAAKVAKDATFMKSLGKTVTTAKKVTSLNNLGFLNKATKLARTEKLVSTAQRSAKIGIDATLVGQVHRFVDNHANLAILGGKEFEKKQENVIKNLMSDFAFGAITGLPSPTLKGVAQSAGIGFSMAYLMDPEDPVGALTDAAVFGSMHAMGSYKEKGFNNIKILGGKKIKDVSQKVDIDLENAMNDSVYRSLRYYDKSLPSIESGGGSVFAKKTTPAEVQKIVEKAEANVWERLFFGRNISKGETKKAMEYFKKRSKQINKDMATKEIPELKGMERFSMSARRARSKKVKAANKLVTEQFGPGYQNKTKLEKSGLPEEMIPDIQAAFTEIKRIRVAGRQLYKGGLSKQMRMKADLDDLLSFSKKDVNRRFKEQEEFLNPIKVKKVVENIDESFFTKTMNNEPMNPNSKYPNGDFAVTGIGVNDVNIKNTTAFMEKVANGEASRNIIVLRRPDLAPIMKMQNEMVSTRNKNAKDGKDYGVDPFPENILQVFGVVKNPKTGEITTVPIPGFVASEHRTNVGKQAFNKNLTKNQKPLKYSKDPISKSMKDNNMDFLIANLDPRFTAETVRSGKPFMPLNVNDANWTQSKVLQKKIDTQGVTNPASVDIADFNLAKNAKELTSLIAKIKKSVTKPASDYVPKPGMNKENVKTAVAVPQEATRVVLETMENSLNVSSPVEVKAAFKHNFGSKLSDSQANYFFNSKSKINTREGIDILNKLAKKGNMDGVSALKLDATNRYLNSGYVEYHGIGKALFEIPIVGSGSKFANTISNAKKETFGVPKTKEIPIVAEGTNTVAPIVESIVAAKAASTKTALKTKAPLTKKLANVPTKTTIPSDLKTEFIDATHDRIKKRYGSKSESKNSAFGVAINEFLTRAKSIGENFIPKSNRDYTGKKDLAEISALEARQAVAITKKPKDLAAYDKAYDKWYSKNEKEILEGKAELLKANEKAEFGASRDAFALLNQLKQIQPAYTSNYPVKLSSNHPKKSWNFFAKPTAENIIKMSKQDLLGIVESMLRNKLNLPREAVDRIMRKASKFEFIDKPFEKIKKDLAIKNPITKKTGFEELAESKRKVTEGIYNWIDSSLKGKTGGYNHSFGHNLDFLLKMKFGDNYRNIPKLKELIGKAMGISKSASNMWKYFKQEKNTLGELQSFDQPLDYLTALAKGDKGGKKLAEAKRKKNLEDNNRTDYENVSKELLLGKGIDEGDLARDGSMRLISAVQEDNMIKGMTKGDEKFLPGLTAIINKGVEPYGPDAVRVGIEDARIVFQQIVKNHNKELSKTQKKYGKKERGKELLTDKFLFEGKERGYKGRYKDLTKEQKASVNKKTNSYFDEMASKYETRLNLKKAKEAIKKTGIEKVIKLKKDIKRTELALSDKSERSNWETDEILTSNLKMMKNKLKIYLRQVKNQTVKDGGGGPGYRDGAGGPKWDWLKSKLGSVKKTITDKWNKLGASSAKAIYPSDSQPRLGKYVNPVTNSIGEPKGPSYNSVRPEKGEPLAPRSGKWTNPVSLNEGGVDTSPDAGFTDIHKQKKDTVSNQVKATFNAPESQKKSNSGIINIPGNSIAARHNNPGNLKYAGQASATQGEPVRDSKGNVIPGEFWARFETKQTGQEELNRQVKLDQERGLTLAQFVEKYAPSSENDTVNYIKKMAGWLGANENTPLKTLDTEFIAQMLARMESSTSF